MRVLLGFCFSFRTVEDSGEGTNCSKLFRNCRDLNLKLKLKIKKLNRERHTRARLTENRNYILDRLTQWSNGQ